MRYERKQERVAPVPIFVRRIVVSFAVIGVLVFSALCIGIAGYHWIAGFSWIDALLNASMILGGMGPVGAVPSTGAKLFASAYALFSGLVFIAVTGIAFAPIAHRVLHKFHADEEDFLDKKPPRRRG